MEIFHYTDLNGLKGIIEMPGFWATNFQFLNDSQEIKHGLACLKNTMPYLEGKIDKKLFILLNSSISYFEKNQEVDVYNISFCKRDDLLSQWRGYASGIGVSLEFDSEELIYALDYGALEGYEKEVIYTRENSTPAMLEETQVFLKKISRILDLNNECPTENLASMLFAVRVLPFFKNVSFEAEKEYRVAIHGTYDNVKVKFRTSMKGMIPYIEIKTFLDKKGKHLKLPLKGVKIGPCDNFDFVEQGVKFFLKKNDYHDVRVTRSQIPFRN